MATERAPLIAAPNQRDDTTILIWRSGTDYAVQVERDEIPTLIGALAALIHQQKEHS